MNNPQAAYTGATANMLGAQRAIPSADAPRAINPSCFGTIDAVAGTVGLLRERLESVVHRMCGNLPPTEPQPAEKLAGDGLFEAATERASDIRRSAERMLSVIDHLERHLP